MPKSTATFQPNLGLYLGQPGINTPQRAFQDGKSFRIKEGLVSNLNMGFDLYSAITFNGPIMLFENVVNRAGVSKLVVGTTKDLYDYNEGADTATYLTPRFAHADTVTIAGAVVTSGGAPAWLTNAKPGDQMAFNAGTSVNSLAGGTGGWFTVLTVNSNTQITLTSSPGIGAGPFSYTLRKVLTSTVDIPWSTTLFVSPNDGVGDDLYFVTDGVDAILTWDLTATQMLYHADLLFTCKNLNVYKNMMIYANLTQNGVNLPTSFINSDIAKPLVAGALSAGIAGQFKVHDDIDPIQLTTILGDNLCVLAERHVTQVQFVGTPLIFVFRDAATGVGPISARAYGNFGDFVEFIGADTQYLFDGVSVTEVGKHVWREVLRLRDPERHHMNFAHFDEENAELIWITALTSDAGVGDANAQAEAAFVEHYLEDVGDRVPSPFSHRFMPFLSSGYSKNIGALTWNQISSEWQDANFRWNDITLFSAFPVSIFGDKDGKLWTINTSQNDKTGQPFPSYVLSGKRPLGDGRMRGLLKRVYPFCNTLPGNMDVTVNLYDGAQSVVQATQTFAFSQLQPEGGHFVSVFRRARYYELKFGSNTDGWSLTGYDVDIVQGGNR